MTAPNAGAGEAKTTTKRKYCIAFGYVGEKYYGLQYNKDPTHPTVEEMLMKALHEAGLITKENMEGPTLHKISWQRASRTDKGVHALRNLISCKLQQPPDGVEACIPRINALLPPDIRVYFMQQVTNSFNSKLFCHGRRYEYYLPTLALMKEGTYNEWLPDSIAPENPNPKDIIAEEEEVAAGSDEDGEEENKRNKNGRNNQRRDNSNGAEQQDKRDRDGNNVLDREQADESKKPSKKEVHNPYPIKNTGCQILCYPITNFIL